eukprot:scaffold1504_cov417-Prasinococcus_capsulatus_cf.AAC.71
MHRHAVSHELCNPPLNPAPLAGVLLPVVSRSQCGEYDYVSVATRRPKDKDRISSSDLLLQESGRRLDHG